MSAENQNLVIVWTFANRLEADIAQGILKAADIESTIRGDDASGWAPHIGFATGGISLLVLESQAEEARKILDGE